MQIFSKNETYPCKFYSLLYILKLNFPQNLKVRLHPLSLKNPLMVQYTIGLLQYLTYNMFRLHSYFSLPESTI